MHHILGQDDLLLLAHIVCKSEVLNKDTSHSYIFDAYSQDTHDSLYPFYYMCVHAFKSNYPLKDCTNLGGALLIIYFSKSSLYSCISLFEALIYMLSSITKKGEIESTFAPLVVLVINNNIYVIELMFLPSIFQEKFNDRDGKDRRLWRYPKMQGNRIGKASSKRTLHFTL